VEREIDSYAHMKLLDRGLLPLYIACVVVLMFHAQWKPAYNWDIIGYVGAVRQAQGLSGAELHDSVFTAVKAGVRDWAYEEMTTSNSYRRGIASDPAALEQSLSFYSIRFAYCGAIRLAESLGMPIVYATHFISALAVGAGLLFLPVFFDGARNHVHLAFLWPASITLGSHAVASRSTSDGLMFLAVVVLFRQLQRRPLLGLILSPLLLSIRPDLVLLALLVQAWLFVFTPRLRVPAAIVAVVTVGLYVALSRHFDFYSYSTTLLFSFTEQPSHVRDYDFQLTVGKYLYILADGFELSIGDPSAMAYLVLMLTTVTLTFATAESPRGALRRLCFDRETQLFVTLPFVYMAGHFVLFPYWRARFFLGLNMLTFIYLYRQIGALLPARPETAVAEA